MGMTRRTATLLWAAMLVVPFAFLGVAFTIGGDHEARDLAGPLLGGAAGVSALNVVLAWVLPPRLGPSRAHDRDAVAFTRVLVSLALGEAAALAPVVAFMITRDPRLLAVLAADVAALLALYPTDGRWDALRPEGEGVPRWREEAS
jgi:drug/metabolite transporter (DMT)-like permease